MIRTLSLIRRLPALDRRAFRDHYESTHAPLALPLMKGLVRYVRYHVEVDLVGPVGFDVLSAFWYRDAESVDALMEALAGPAGEAILEDEKKFMDKPAIQFFPVSERSLVAGDEGDEHVFVLVKRPPGTTRFDFSADLLREHAPALLGGCEGTAFALLRDAFPMAAGEAPERDEPRYDAVLQLRAARYGGLEGWAKGLVERGHRVTAVRTRRFETERAGASA